MRRYRHRRGGTCIRLGVMLWAAAVAILATPTPAAAADASTLVAVTLESTAAEGRPAITVEVKLQPDGTWKASSNRGEIPMTVSTWKAAATELVLENEEQRTRMKIDLASQRFSQWNGEGWMDLGRVTNVVHRETVEAPAPTAPTHELFRRLDANADAMLDGRDFTESGWGWFKRYFDLRDATGMSEIGFAEALKARAKRSKEAGGAAGAPELPPRDAGPRPDLFALLDHDKDGSLTSADFSEGGWRTLLAFLGRTGDAPLTRSEFLDALKRHEVPAARPATDETAPTAASLRTEDQALGAVFQRFDGNGDGKVNRADFSEDGWQRILRLGIDADGNGELSTAELRKHETPTKK